MSHPDMYPDGIFHTAKESDLDHQINAMKTRFAEELQPRLAKIEGLRSIQVIHAIMSSCITIDAMFKQYKFRLRYDPTSHRFEEPCTTLGNISLEINGGRIFGFYDREPDVGDAVQRIFACCYEVSQIDGLGSRYGDNWQIEECAVELAKIEMIRLMEVSLERTKKDQAEKEARKKRDEEFIARITNKN
jgi:hypothetical protein